MSRRYSSAEEAAQEFLKKKKQYDENKQKTELVKFLEKALKILLQIATNYLEKQLKK